MLHPEFHHEAVSLTHLIHARSAALSHHPLSLIFSVPSIDDPEPPGPWGEEIDQKREEK